MRFEIVSKIYNVFVGVISTDVEIKEFNNHEEAEKWCKEAMRGANNSFTGLTYHVGKEVDVRKGD